MEKVLTPNTNDMTNSKDPKLSSSLLRIFIPILPPDPRSEQPVKRIAQSRKLELP
jgi:hypothetical protein